ncbi:Collagen triple helix repeat-containing protein [Curtobacterium sp. 9128]|uniref:hypothetical protein n=1 Tax=Curtobacterium sp. 9128 TaxID=1793722 RepID=UPI0007D73711|nr:hypothetical protein [Curtobacterium sp. 9128]SBN64468.1 Collagen triple helix repeat-containing protein [Curtobacterium sp. 9128]
MVRLRRFLRVDRLGWAFAIIVTMGLVGLIVYALASQQATIDNLRSRNRAIAAQGLEGQKQYRELVEQYTQLTDQAKAAGVEPDTLDPSAIPKTIPGPSGTAGARGAAGNDGRGVAFALCTATGWAVTYTDGETENGGDCIGKNGPIGKTGTDGNDGSPGLPGATGTAGKDGVDGQPGANGADGATGAKGDTGATGPTGTGFTSVTCATTDDGSTVFRFTLTDGTTQDVAGTCSPTTPDPTETPAP